MKSGRRCVIAAGVIAGFGLLIEPAYSQQANSNSYTDLSQYLISGSQVVPQQQAASGTAYNTTSIVKQAGENNSATATLVGSGDITTQIQNGSGNSSTVSINGSQNALSTTQIGNSNTVALSVVGNDSSISNLQVGKGLSYQLSVVGAPQTVSVQQYGRK
ncbi:MAG: hypothetical protein WDN29_02610 [Methylovirgula sp.]